MESRMRVVVPKPPQPSSAAAQSVMRGNRRRDTRPELVLRAALHRLGLRYRVDLKIGHGRSAPRPDVAFTRARVAVFLDGCFWHGCPEHGVQPRTNPHYWSAKVARNQERDQQNQLTLEQGGWLVVRIWEHEDVAQAAQRIQRLVRARSDLPRSACSVRPLRDEGSPLRCCTPDWISAARGSTVRVRQRALQKPRKSRLFLSA